MLPQMPPQLQIQHGAPGTKCQTILKPWLFSHLTNFILQSGSSFEKTFGYSYFCHEKM